MQALTLAVSLCDCRAWVLQVFAVGAIQACRCHEMEGPCHSQPRCARHKALAALWQLSSHSGQSARGSFLCCWTKHALVRELPTPGT